MIILRFSLSAPNPLNLTVFLRLQHHSTSFPSRYEAGCQPGQHIISCSNVNNVTLSPYFYLSRIFLVFAYCFHHSQSIPDFIPCCLWQFYSLQPPVSINFTWSRTLQPLSLPELPPYIILPQFACSPVEYCIDFKFLPLRSWESRHHTSPPW